MPFRYSIRERDYLPNLDVPDTRPASAINPKRDWGVEGEGGVLVQIGDRAHMVVTVEELIKHAARINGKVKEE